MFKLQGNLKFVNINIEYLEYLHSIDGEVRFSKKGYEHKPFIGLFVVNDEHQYVIPLTSAKSKFKTWSNEDNSRGCYLIYEYVDKARISVHDIYVDIDGSSSSSIVKHIISMIDVKKMIPVTNDVIMPIDINYNEMDSMEDYRYKSLLNKEYTFCLKIIDVILKKVNSLYDKQTLTGKVQRYCCNFKLLENHYKNFNV